MRNLSLHLVWARSLSSTPPVLACLSMNDIGSLINYILSEPSILSETWAFSPLFLVVLCFVLLYYLHTHPTQFSIPDFLFS